MSTPRSLIGSRPSRVLRRGFAALALVLSIAAPLHGLLHDHHDHAEPVAGAAVHEASHEAQHAAEDCPLCTPAGSHLLQARRDVAGPLSLPSRLLAAGPLVLASRDGAIAPARGPPAPTC
jgi:hypothetical protein